MYASGVPSRLSHHVQHRFGLHAPRAYSELQRMIEGDTKAVTRRGIDKARHTHLLARACRHGVRLLLTRLEREGKLRDQWRSAQWLWSLHPSNPAVADRQHLVPGKQAMHLFIRERGCPPAALGNIFSAEDPLSIAT